MDVWINFKNATKWQAGEIFKNFFPYKRFEPPAPSTSQGEIPEQKGRSRRKDNAPVLNEDELTDLAKRFSEAVPDDEMSVRLDRGLEDYLCAWLTEPVQVAAIQGYLLRNKTRPKEAVEEVAEW
jgi:chaperone BCS1